jgi:hypothetical protein
VIGSRDLDIPDGHEPARRRREERKESPLETFSNLPPEFREAEAMLNRLRGVTSSHIVLDAGGGVAEVHVMATRERHPKQIVRDVESTLLHKLGVKVDHRKISVASIDEDEKKRNGPHAGEEGAEGATLAATRRSRPFMAESAESADGGETPDVDPFGAPRLRFAGMNLQVTGAGCQARVELVRGPLRSIGDSSTPASGAGAYRSVAEATLRAVMHCFEQGPAFALDDITFIKVAQREAVLVSVGYHVGRDAVHLLGSTFVGNDPQQAVIFATLDAVNRFSGRLKEREFIEYEVGPAPARS